MRSRIPIIQARAKEIITELKKNKDLLDLVLDEFAPLPETDDAEQTTAGDNTAPQPTCKFMFPDGEHCGLFADREIHGTGPSQHKFQVRKSRTKKSLPDSVGKRITEDVNNAKAIKPGDCVQCKNPADANIHHLANTAGFHEFKEAA